MPDQSLAELLSRGDDLKLRSAELFAQHELLHNDLDYAHPVIGPEPPDPPPPPRL
jgi:hypothetical protein